MFLLWPQTLSAQVVPSLAPPVVNGFALVAPPSLAAAAAAPHGAALAAEFRAHRLASRVIPAAVRNARVEARVIEPGAADGATLTITRIAPPVLPSAAVAPAPRVVSPFTAAQRAAMRAAAPLQTLLFAPSITLYPDDVSYVEWTHVSLVDNQRSLKEFAAWVPWSLASVHLCGDFEVARTRYVLSGMAHPVSPKTPKRAVPDKNESDMTAPSL